MINIKNTNKIFEINFTQWEQLLLKSSRPSFFQTKTCYDFYSSLSFLDPFIFSVTESDVLKGIIVGYIQKDKVPTKQYFTKRAIIPGGLLLADDISDSALESLLNFCKRKLHKEAIYIECRNFNSYSKLKNIFELCEFKYIPHLNFHIDTTSLEIVNNNIGKSRKRDIKLSLREGAVVIDNPSLEEVKAFYLILEDLYKQRIKTPLFPWIFFEKLFTSTMGKFMLVKYKDQIIGGTICVGLENKVLYEMFACGLDGKFKNIYPSTLATWAGIEYAATHNYYRFDMMGAGKPDESYGVRDFKAKFGGELVEHGRFLCILHPLLYQIGKFGLSILKRI